MAFCGAAAAQSVTIMPIPVEGGTVGRTDQGVDISGRPGAKLFDPVPGVSTLIGKIANWYQGQPFYWFRSTIGKYWYAAEQVDITVPQGGTVSQGQQIGTYAGSGTATEWGWATASGQTLARATTGYTEGQVTPAGSDFRSSVIQAPGGPAGSTPASGTPAKVNAWRVVASQESDGGTGACGPIGSGGMWFSELSTVPMGTGSDFAALGKLPCGTVLNIQANGITVKATKRDVGAGSSFLPVMGIYPATAAALKLSGGQYTLVIWREDGQPLHPVRGTPVSASGSFGGSRPVSNPGSGGSAAPADTGAAVNALFDTYQAEINAPRTAPASGFVSLGAAGWAAPFQWWLQSFLGKWQAGQVPGAAPSPLALGGTSPASPGTPGTGGTSPGASSSPAASSSPRAGATTRRSTSARTARPAPQPVYVLPASLSATPAPPSGTSAWNAWFNRNFNKEWTALKNAVTGGNLTALQNQPPASNEGALAAFRRFFAQQGQ